MLKNEARKFAFLNWKYYLEEFEFPPLRGKVTIPILFTLKFELNARQATFIIPKLFWGQGEG